MKPKRAPAEPKLSLADQFRMHVHHSLAMEQLLP